MNQPKAMSADELNNELWDRHMARKTTGLSPAFSNDAIWLRQALASHTQYLLEKINSGYDPYESYSIGDVRSILQSEIDNLTK